jgi:hypothetical protein
LFLTHIEGNLAPGAGGSLIFAEGSASSLQLEGVQIWSNDAARLLVADNLAEMVAAFVTVAGNSYDAGSGPVGSRVIHVAGGAQAALYSSLLWNSSGSSTATGGTLFADCVLADNLTGFPPSGSIGLVGDPRFVDLAAGNLRLRHDSPAVDYCDDVYYTPSFPDLDFLQRGWDHPLNPNGSPGIPFWGVYDLGAYEARPIFADGFETGTTVGWSATVP